MNISDIGKEMLNFQARLAKEYNYKPINQISLEYGDVREKYRNTLPEWCDITGSPDKSLYTLEGTKIGTGYTRIVIGDYGAFVEISPEQIVQENLIVKKGQEFRLHAPQYKDRVKYHWLTTNDKSDCKIYFQQKTVSYADYLPGMYYISPYECALIPQRNLDEVISKCATQVKPELPVKDKNKQIEL